VISSFHDDSLGLSFLNGFRLSGAGPGFWGIASAPFLSGPGGRLFALLQAGGHVPQTCSSLSLPFPMSIHTSYQMFMFWQVFF